MTSQDDLTALALLRAIGRLRRRLIDFSRVVRSELEPATVTMDVVIPNYERTFPESPEYLLEAYVEAELVNGNAVDWGLDVTHDGQVWHFEPSVTWSGQDEVVSVAARTCEHVADFGPELSATLDSLFATLEEVSRQLQVEATSS